MAALLLVLAGAGLLWLGLLAVLVALMGGRHPRRGGYIKPPASRGLSRAVIRTPLEMAVSGYFSSSLPLGGVSEVWAGPRWLRDQSRITGRGWSTLGTAARGESGAPLEDAA